MLRYLIPDIPTKLKEKIRRENFIINELMIRNEDPNINDESETEDEVPKTTEIVDDIDIFTQL